MSNERERSLEGIRGPEKSSELQEAAAEARERIKHSPETADNSAEKIEAAREVIEKQAEKPAPSAAEEESPKKHHPTHHDKKASYWQTVHAMQRRLRPMSKRFSKVIHAPAIETASEALGKTVMRPSVTLGATTSALFVGAFFYLTARRYGFILSGSEFLLSLLVGGILGAVLEFALKPFRKKS